MGKTISFLEAELYNDDGTLLAKATSTARVIHRAPA
jgi:acyl-coenzyme A thioesterase PaaI-like protein